MNAVLIIDKPSGLTSHDVVARLRAILSQQAVGHLGTLDPIATGILPLALGKMTRLAQFYLASEKSYEGVIKFGFATDTYDAEGEPMTMERGLERTLEEVREMAKKFHGKIEQMPPPFSAKKIHGVPAYKLARKKKDVPLKPATVEITEFEIIDLQDRYARFRARVGSGTYIRSIAHDLGQMVGCGAHLQTLRRTVVGEFTLADARSFDEIEQAAHEIEAERESLFIHPRRLLPAFPSVTAADDVVNRIRHGQAVNLPEFSRAKEVKVFSGQHNLIAVATRVAGTLFHPKIVLT